MLAIGGHGTSIRTSSTCTALLRELAVFLCLWCFRILGFEEFVGCKNKDMGTTVEDEQDLSLGRLNEYKKEKVLQCVNEVHSLCSVLGLDFGQTVGYVHRSLHGTQVEQSTNISNSTLEGLEQAILKLKIERKTGISEGDFSTAYLIAFRLIGCCNFFPSFKSTLFLKMQLKDVVAKLFELWNLMDSSKEERNCFMKITSIVETSESEITERGVLSTEMIEKGSAEVDRLAKLKASRMKELVFKKRSELEEICRLTHIEPDPSTVAEKASALIDSGMFLSINRLFTYNLLVAYVSE
ncbi:65-kDa microtubule-associated protein 6 [Glycine max]|nr:65-kDa microtubule-associated protein 6 [Glycine max]